jgi:hypothetical protein
MLPQVDITSSLRGIQCSAPDYVQTAGRGRPHLLPVQAMRNSYGCYHEDLARIGYEGHAQLVVERMLAVIELLAIRGETAYR